MEKEYEREIQPGFRLNCHDRNVNPLYESHDPSMMYDPVSGLYYSYATDSAITSPHRQGIPVRKSSDLVHFQFVGYALSDAAVAEGRDNGEYPPTPGFWAPYVEYARGEYRMYYSATRAFGSSESRIWLAAAKNPEGPFENRGVVMDTWGTDDTYPNAIDAHVIDDEYGKKYLVYGSFFGGIYMKELDPETGLCASGDVHELGRRIAHRPENSYIDGPEGAAVIRSPQTGLYYLFLSYGWLGDDYDIRVGMSRTIKGPYRDMDGKNLDGESLGVKLAGSYFFSAKAPYAAVCGTEPPRTIEVKAPWGNFEEMVSYPDWKFEGFRGPGHGVPFYNVPEEAFYFVHHVRDGAQALCHRPENDRCSYRMHYMVVRRMYFVNDWPVFSPEPFAGEKRADDTVYSFRVEGGIPVGGEAVKAACGAAQADDGQGMDEAQADDGQSMDEVQADDRQGRAWEWIVFSNMDNSIVRGQCGVSIPSVTAVMGEAFDFENGGMCRVLSGYTGDGRSVWAKEAELELRIPVDDMVDLEKITRDEAPGNPYRVQEETLVSEEVADEVVADV